MNDNFFKNEFEKLVDWVLASDDLPVEVKKKLILDQAEAYANNKALDALNKINVYGKSLIG